MKVQIISSGLPNLFNIEFRRWWEEKRKQGYDLEDIFARDIFNDYKIPYEFCALSYCYFHLMVGRTIPSFETLKAHLSKKSDLKWILEDEAADKNRIVRFLKNHILTVQKLYDSEDLKWQRLTKSIKAEIKVNRYVKSLLELLGEKNLPLKRCVLVPAFYSRAGTFEDITIEYKSFESLKRFLNKNYNRTDTEIVCPPVYYGENEVILIPLHESGTYAGNPLIFDFTLVHEICHALTIWLTPVMIRYSPKGIKPEMDSFSRNELEVITDILTIKILAKHIGFPSYVNTFLESSDWNKIFDDFRKFLHLIAKAKQLFSQEESLEALPLKRLKGILKKKMDYQGLVKGLDRNQLIKLIKKKICKPENEIVGQIRVRIRDIKKEINLIEGATILQRTADTFLHDSRMAKFYKALLNEGKSKPTS